jgi:hypothetical protein
MPPTSYGYEQLTHYARTHASKATAATIEYALGKSMLNAVNHSDGSVQSTRALGKRAKEHLNTAAASDTLGVHRRQIVDALVAAKGRRKK